MANLNFDASKVQAWEAPVDITDQPRDTGKKWSEYQKAVFEFVEHGEGNAIVEAVAGSGKSTTIVEALKLARGQTIFLAFNKSIADELKKRGVNARTFHSLCFGPVMRHYRQQNPEMNKLRLVMDSLFTREQVKLYGTFAQKLVGLAKGMGIGCLVADTEIEWISICEHHDLQLDSEFADFSEAIELSRALFDASLKDPRIDFDDMLYLAVRDGITLPKFDFVFVDEAQDTNPIQRALLRKILANGGRLIAVGDPAQAIYGFRGSDSESMAMIAKEFNAITLPLSITYRCPTSVVKYVQQWVSHIKAADTAEEGVVKNLGEKWDPKDLLAQDLIVCRKTAPLITTAFKLIRANVPVQVLGREIGQGLKNLIRKMNASNVDQLVTKLEAYAQREVEKALAKNDEQKVEQIGDTVGSLIYIIEGLKEGYRTFEWLEKGIDYLFADKANAVVMSTIHKAKGLEADRVFWLGRSECPAMWARRQWQLEQEINLCYVAATRAKKELYFIEIPRA